MMYTKPSGVKYTDMAIWVDENAYSSECDENKMFEYIYLIVEMLARKGKYFTKARDYDDYAIYASTYIFMRYKSPKQFETTNDGKPKMKKIKSVLNYAKHSVYPLKLSYLRKEYREDGIESCDISSLSLRDEIVNSVDEMNVSNFRLYMGDIPNTIRSFLSSVPYPKDSVEFENIYTSVLLTFLNSITPSEDGKEAIDVMIKGGKIKQPIIDKIYNEARDSKVILYHLDDSLRNYVETLTNEVRHIIYADLSQILHEYVPSYSYKVSSRNIEDDIDED